MTRSRSSFSAAKALFLGLIFLTWSLGASALRPGAGLPPGHGATGNQPTDCGVSKSGEKHGGSKSPTPSVAGRVAQAKRSCGNYASGAGGAGVGECAQRQQEV